MPDLDDTLAAMRDALLVEVATVRADRTLQGRDVHGGARLGTAGKRTTYAFPDVAGARYPDDTPVKLLLEDDEVDGEVASHRDGELVLALASDLGAMVEHAVLVADASFLLERLAARLDEVLDGTAVFDAAMAAAVLDPSGIVVGVRPAVPPPPGLNDEQAAAVAQALGSSATYVWGPPGTGKTTTVGALVAEHVRAGRSVLLVANTNTAVDTALQRVAELLDGHEALAEGRVLRHGTIVKPELADKWAGLVAPDAVAARLGAPLLDERSRVAGRLDAIDVEEESDQQTLDADYDAAEERSTLRRRLEELDDGLAATGNGLLDNAVVIATTVYQTWLGGLPERTYDVVVVDEASMLMLPMTAYAAGLAETSVVIAGDFRQLPAIVSSDDPEVLRWLATDAFSEVGIPRLLASGAPPPYLAALSTQYRMRPAIADLVTDLFYADNPLRTGRTVEPDRPPLLVLDTSTLGAWAAFAGRGSRYNPVHAVVVAALVSVADEGVVGIVTPYAAQERLVAALLTDRHGREARGWVSTVHRFQGNEKDVIVVDLADAPGASPGPGSRAVGRDDPQSRLLNVAVSRARDQLVVLGDAAFLAEKAPAGSMAAMLLRELRRRGTALPVDDLVRGPWSLVDADAVEAAVLDDLARATEDVALFSPTLTGHGMARWSAALRTALARGVAVRVVTRPPAEQRSAATLLDQMREAGVEVDLWAGMGECLLSVDGDVTWLGGTPLGVLPAADPPRWVRARGTALATALADLLRPVRSPKRPLGEPTNPPCPRCDGPTVLRRGGGAAAYVCLLGRSCSGLTDVPEDARGDRPDNATGPCRQPGCDGWLVPRRGRYGAFTSCTRYPACSGR